MEERAVVTVFLRNRGQVLLLERSEEVGSYPGRWGGVAGHAEGDPDRAAMQEIGEETGLSDEEVELVRRGDPFEVTDEELGIRWTVHPYLFDAETRAIETDWETAAAEWVHPTEILARDTVPELWTSYDRIRPRVSTVETDETHGSAYIAVRALEVLRDEAMLLAAAEEPWTAIAAVATDLRDARPEMAAVRNHLDHVMFEASAERTPAAVERAAKERIEAAAEADLAAARRATSVVEGASVFTLSRSGTVLQAIEEGDAEEVTVAVSRPGGEGRTVASRLSATGVDVTLTSDANVPAAVERADAVLVGADSVLPDATLVNKVGTTSALVAAEWFDTPAYVVCAAAKIRPETNIELPAGDSRDLADPDAGFAVANPVFERTPLAPADGFITERGVLDTDEVAAVAQEYAEYATWHRE